MNIGTLLNSKNKNVGTLPDGKIPMLTPDSFNLFPNINPYGAVEKMATQSKQKADIAIAQGKKSFQDYLKTEGAYLTKHRTPREMISMLAPPVGGVEKVGAGIVSDAVRAGAKEIAPMAENALKAEALKYPTAQEFIDSHAKVFRGDTNGKGIGFGAYGNGTYLTKELATARQYGKNIGEFTINKTAKILDASKHILGPKEINFFENRLVEFGNTLKVAKDKVANLLDYTRQHSSNINNFRGELEYMMKQVGFLSNKSTEELMSIIKKKGFDGIKYKSAPDIGEVKNGTNFVIFNKNLVNTSQQLKDIWQNAHNSVFQGFVDYSTQLLDTLKGKTDVPTGYVTSEINRLKGATGMTPAEIGHYQTALADATNKGKVNVQAFADNVHTNLLPITHDNGLFKTGGDYSGIRRKYSAINLPLNEQQNVIPSSYKDVIYSSPIKTDAGNTHFREQIPQNNYFAHVRRQDLTNGTRQVVETQSDLMQGNNLSPNQGTTPAEMGNAAGFLQSDLNKLTPYKNTWYQPVIRSEIKQAAQDGMKNIRFPTGETAMKVEGLNIKPQDFKIVATKRSIKLTTENMKVGMEVRSKTESNWTITDVIGNGRFKATPFTNKELAKPVFDMNPTELKDINQYAEQFNISGKTDTSHGVYKKYEKIGKWLKNRLGAKQITDANGNGWYNIPINKASAKAPIQMHGKATIGGLITGVLGTATVGLATMPSVTVVNHIDKPPKFPKMTNAKWDSVGAVIYGEARANQHDMMEIASTIYNRLKDPHNKGKNPYDIITQKGDAGYQYNAFGQKQYKIYKSGKFDILGEVKAQMVQKIVNEMRAGIFKPINNATGFHYLHGKTLILDYKKLFGMLDMLGKRGSQLATTIGSLWNQHQVNVAKQQVIDNYAVAHMYVKNALGNRVFSPEYTAYINRIGHSIQPPVGGIEDIAGNVAKDAAKAVTPAVENAAKTVGDILSKGATQAERQFIKRIKEMAPEVPGLKGALTKRSTDVLVSKADAIIAKDPAKAMSMAKNGKNDLSVAVASRLLDNFIGQARIATDEVTKNALYSKAAEVANTAAKNLTEHGRAVQAATILGKLTPEGMTRWAAGQIQKYNEQASTRTLRNFLGGAKQIPNLTPEQSKFIVDEMTRIEGIGNKDLKAQAFGELQDKVKSWIPSSLYSKVIGLWKAGLLTGIKTSGLNILSNINHGVSEVAKDAPGALVDKITSLFTGKRTLALTTRGNISGLKEGIQKGWRFFRTGYDERNSLGKLDYTKVNFGKGKIAHAMQAYEEKIFTILGSEDQPFYYGAKAHSLISQGIAIAKNEGLKGSEMIKRANQLVANPDEKMLEYAVLDAQTSVFQNTTELGKAARAIQDIPGGQVVLPFGKTPSAVATQIINYSPIGIVKTIVENIGKGRFDQRLFSQGMGRGITGTGTLFIGGALYNAGLMTGPRPTNSAQKALWEIEGKQPYSIYYGGEWRNLGTLGPVGMVLGVGGAMRQGFNQTGSFVGGLGAALGAVGGTLTQQTFLYGINQAINALNQPSQYGPRFIRNLVGSAIPTIVADVARATDPYQRKAGTVGQRIASRIPGLRRVLPKRVDALGTPEKSGGFFTTMLDATRPYNPTENLTDPVVKELIRLDKAGYNATPTMVGGNNGFKTLTPHQNSQLWIAAGSLAKDAIANIIKDPTYNMLDNEQKAKILEKVVGPTKDHARGESIYNATKDMTGVALESELAKMRTDKLLTKYTYAWYYSLGGRGKYPIIKP